MSTSGAAKHVSLPRIFSEGDPTEWFKRYEICCTANDWSDEVKAKKLPTLLEGEALATWLELTAEQQASYTDAKARMLERLSPVQFVSMDDFHRRHLMPGESLPLFVHELKRLMEQAMPKTDVPTRQQLLIHQFLTGLPDAVSKQLRATGDIDDLDKLVQRAKLLMTIDAQGSGKPEEKSAAVQQPLSQMEALTEQVAALTEQVAAINLRYPRQPARLLCFHCNQPGHVQRNCPLRSKRCYTCGRMGHLAKDCRSGNGQGASRKGWGRP